MDPIPFRKCVCISYLFFVSFSVLAFDNYLTGSRSIALSGCGVTFTDVWSVSQNQAGLAGINFTQVGLYHEQRFMMKELSLNSITLAYPVKPIVLGVHLNYFGYSKYYEMKTCLAAASQLGKKIFAGVQLDYFSQYSVTAASTRKRITVELGLITFPSESVTVGFHVFNPFLEKPKANVEAPLPSIARLGISYTVRQTVTLIAETRYDFSNNPVLQAGIEYSPIKILDLRFGVSTGTSHYSFGVGYHWKRIIMGFGYANHPELGSTPAFDLVYSF